MNRDERPEQDEELERSISDLWRVEHPYYAAEGRHIAHYDDFEDFRAEWRGLDEDQNFVYRWDIHPPTDASFEEHHPEDPSERAYELEVTMIQQRRSRITTCYIKVSREDEPAIREYLAGKWENIREMWGPVSEAGP
jgi:hypothetical protein